MSIGMQIWMKLCKSTGVAFSQPLIQKRQLHNIYSKMEVNQSHLISGYNYIGTTGIYFKHNDSSYVLRMTTDREAAIEGNRLNNDNSTVYWYISDRILPEMIRKFDSSKIMKCMNELNQWELFKELNPVYKIWALRLARVHMPQEVTFQQYVFATKVFSSTFVTDDPMEKLSSNKKWFPVFDYYFDSLVNIFKRKIERKPNMYQFKGQLGLPDELLKDSQVALNIQQDLVSRGKDILHPKVYLFYLEQALKCIEFNKIEREKYSEAFENRKYMPRDEILKTRAITIGAVWTMAPLITDPLTIPYLDPYNPFVFVASWSCTCDNDVIGYWKDAKSVDFSPLQLVQSLVQSGTDETHAAKKIAHESNLLKMNLDDQFQLMPDHIRKHYHGYWILMNALVDYCFIQGMDEVNTRYGWYPVKD